MGRAMASVAPGDAPAAGARGPWTGAPGGVAGPNPNAAPNIGADLGAIGHTLLPVAVAGGVIMILASTRLYAVAWVMLAAALIYVAIYRNGASVFTDIANLTQRGVSGK